EFNLEPVLGEDALIVCDIEADKGGRGVVQEGQLGRGEGGRRTCDHDDQSESARNETAHFSSLSFSKANTSWRAKHSKDARHPKRKRASLARRPLEWSDDVAQPQPCTARRAITLTRCARYSALAWISELSPPSLCLMSLTASGEKLFDNAVSISF